nr:uncharacterized protein LOC110361373 isoform X5 [Columba livia]
MLTRSRHEAEIGPAIPQPGLPISSCPLWQRQPGHPLLVKLRPPEGQTSGATSPTTTQTILPTRRTLLQVIPDLLHMIFVSDNLLSSDLLKPAYETKLSQTLDLGINYLLMLWPCIPAQVQTSGGKKTCTPGSGGDTRGTPAWKFVFIQLQKGWNSSRLG